MQVAVVMVGILIRAGNVSLGSAAAGSAADAAAEAVRQRLGLTALLASSFGYCVFGACLCLVPLSAWGCAGIIGF